MKNKIKMVIFDMDGVLFDSGKIAEKHLFMKYPDITIEMQMELLSGNFHEELSKLSLKHREETEIEKAERVAWYIEEKSKSPMYDGARELLEILHNKNIIIALNTSAYERNCIPLLQNAGITELFDFLGTAEISKSKAEKFKIMEEKYGFKNNEVLFVTDTLGDLREADVAGVPTVCVTWGVHNEDYFTREKHDNLVDIVDTFEELEKIIFGK